MLDNTYDSQNCSVARTLEVVGERWNLLIVRELLRRPHRFRELERRLGIAKNVLATRLAKLETAGIIEASPSAARDDWNDYGLTSKGKDLLPVVAALMAWGDRHAAPFGAPAVFEHHCGHPAGHRLVCEHCEEPLHIDDLRVIPGPGLSR